MTFFFFWMTKNLMGQTNTQKQSNFLLSLFIQTIEKRNEGQYFKKKEGRGRARLRILVNKKKEVRPIISIDMI